jgi:transcriptional regulator with PAS, ATPase and Fis domain
MKLEGVDVDWEEEFNGAITICDRNGIIVYMNQYSINQFKKYGGEKLLGTNLLDCHPEPSKSKLREMLESPGENMYTSEKEGRKKIILQTPWLRKGVFSGVVEISFQLDATMPHHFRK